MGDVANGGAQQKTNQSLPGAAGFCVCGCVIAKIRLPVDFGWRYRVQLLRPATSQKKSHRSPAKRVCGKRRRNGMDELSALAGSEGYGVCGDDAEDEARNPLPCPGKVLRLFRAPGTSDYKNPPTGGFWVEAASSIASTKQKRKAQHSGPFDVERKTRLELATSTLARWRSTR